MSPIEYSVAVWLRKPIPQSSISYSVLFLIPLLSDASERSLEVVTDRTPICPAQNYHYLCIVIIDVTPPPPTPLVELVFLYGLVWA